MYLILPCFDWIGFHLCEKLLYHGEQVIGIGEATTVRQDNFWAFLARNSSFQLFPTVEEYQTSKTEANLEAIIQIETEQKAPVPDALKASRKFLLNGKMQERPTNKEDWCHVELPMLYGEWMPRSKDSMFSPDGGEVPFDSQTFHDDAVYIKDFLQEFFPLLKTKQSKKHVIISPSGDQEGQRETDAEVIPVFHSESTGQRQKKLQRHYEKFISFY
ncbi:hypothetical protein [Sediminibacillus sp. JSM 1682029]|uniref:hypothetical protein n=1 Tax=Sediminibacillus sp. JSM 1682029 TaxID=3229857 RepID=UPI00047B170A